MAQLDGLVDAGNTVIVVEHDMRVVAGSDWVIDIGPGAGDEGGRDRRGGTPAEVARLDEEPDRAVPDENHAVRTRRKSPTAPGGRASPRCNFSPQSPFNLHSCF